MAVKSTLVLALFAVASVPVHAALMDPPQTPREKCEPIEYAELSDMARPELEQTYCQASKLAVQRDLEADTAGKMASATGGRWYAQQAAFQKFGAQCREQATRMKGIFVRRFTAEPNCSPASK